MISPSLINVHVRMQNLAVSFRVGWMRIWKSCVLTVMSVSVTHATDLEGLPVLPGPVAAPTGDYLVGRVPQAAAAYRNDDSSELVLDNGLVRRTWRLAPNAACVAYENRMTDAALLRAVRPEARVTIDGVKMAVGGLVGQPNQAYLDPEWLETMRADPGAFVFEGFELGRPKPRLKWYRRRHAAPGAAWPPNGIHLRMNFTCPQLDGIRLTIHYELYDGIPVMSKWLSLQNASDRMVRIDGLVVEELALVEHSNWVETRDGVAIPRPDGLHVETDFAFGGFNHQNANRHVVHWRQDPDFETQVNYLRQTPCLLVVEPTYGPSQRIEPGDNFESFRVFQLAVDGDRERRGLALRRMYRTVAPWVTENPITHHLLSNREPRVREAIEQAADVGFESVILSFGSGFDMENEDPEFIRRWQSVAQFAEEKGIELGSYSLFSSRNVGETHMIVSPPGQQPTHGQCPAVTSSWGQGWLQRIESFYRATGFDQFENDGPYPGDVDVTARPPWQEGIHDSRWIQWRHVTNLYRDLRGMGIYINAPDYYFLMGTNKCGMGYREVNWSLPRAQQVIHTRQNIYDGTWTKTPSMGWMFVPLSQYHGGGAAATIEPLSEHIDHYRQMLRSNLGMGVQAHYRGPRLFDSDETRAMVKRQVAWFKQYRDILESDLIHGRRADGRGLDWVLHVNPHLEVKGMLCVFNPLRRPVEKTLHVNVYYTGLTDVALVSHERQQPRSVPVKRDFTVELTVSVPPQGMTWYLLR